MDKLMATLNEYLAAAKGVLVTYAPQVWEATLALIRFNSIFHLVLGLVFLISLAICVKVFLYNIEKYDGGRCRDEEKHVVGCVVSCLIGVVCLIGSMTFLFCMEYWLGAFYPELAVIYKIAEKAGLL